MNIIPKYLWKVIINRKREAQLLQALTGFSHQHLFCGTFSQIILTKFDSILTDSVSLIQILERTKYNANCFWFILVHYTFSFRDARACPKKHPFEFWSWIFPENFWHRYGYKFSPQFWQKLIDSGFGIFEGIQNEVEYWIKQYQTTSAVQLVQGFRSVLSSSRLATNQEPMTYTHILISKPHSVPTSLVNRD